MKIRCRKRSILCFALDPGTPGIMPFRPEEGELGDFSGKGPQPGIDT